MKNTMILNISKKALSLLLTFVMVLSSIITLGPIKAEAATTFSYTFTRVYYGEERTGIFTVPSHKLSGVCGQKGTGGNSGKATLSYQNRSSDYAHVAYYYGYYLGWGNKNDPEHALKLSKTLTHITDPDKYDVAAVENRIKTARNVEVPTGFYVYKGNPTDGSQDFFVWRMVNGSIQIQKSASAKAPSGYNFDGIEYTVYKNDKQTEVGKLTLDSSGLSNKLSVPSGMTYYVKETKTNEYFELDDTWYDAKISYSVLENTTSANSVLLKVKDAPKYGNITIRKAFTADSDEGGTLDGFTFTLYKDGVYYDSETTDASGYVTFDNLPIGVYSVRETISSHKENAHRYEDATYLETIDLRDQTDITRTWYNKYTENAGIVITKSVDDADSRYATPLNEFNFEVNGLHDNAETLTEARAINLANIQTTANIGEWSVSGLNALNNAAKNSETKSSTPGNYVLTFTNTLDDGTPVSIDVNVNLGYVGTSTTTTAKSVDVNGNTFNYNDFGFAGAATKMKGTYSMASSGYLRIDDLDPGWYTVTEKMTDAQKLHYSVNRETIGPVYLAEDDVEVFSFENTTKRSEVVLKKESADGNIVNKTFKLSGQTVWGQNVEITKSTDINGYLTFGKLHKGTYTVTEESFDADEYKNSYPLDGHDKPSIQFTVTGDDATLYIGGEYKHGSASATEQTFKNIPVPDVDTLALDNDTRTHFSNADNPEGINIIDIVRYKRLVPGNEYTLEGKLVDQKTGEVLKDDNDKEITATTVFSPTEAKGSAQVKFNIANGTNLAGKTAVVFEKLYLNGEEINSHEDLDNEDQTIRFPVIKTEAKDSLSDSHTIAPNDTAEIIDTVTYENLIPGEKYSVSGYLVDAETGKPFNEFETTGEEDTELIGTSGEFVPTEPNGTVEVKFNFDSRDMIGKKIVVFEQLIWTSEGSSIVENPDIDNNLGEDAADTPENEINIHVIAMHENVNDENQTVNVSVPEVTTELVNTKTGAHISYTDKEAVYKDSVNYTNLVPGKTYTLKGKLVDAATYGKDTEEETIESGNKFNPDENITDIVGDQDQNTEDTEEENANDNGVAALADNDPSTGDNTENTNNNPTGDTDNNGSADTDNSDNNDNNAGDTNSGETNEDTPKEEGVFATAEITFVPEESSGSAEVEFKLDASLLADHKTVALEDLYLGDKMVGQHADVTDENQSVYIPGVKTTATVDDEHTATASKETVVKDTVEYSNLMPSATYTVKGYITCDGETVSDVSEVELEAKESAGQVDVEIKFDSSKYAGKDVVAYEEVYLGDELVASHMDAEDKDQTISIVKEKAGLVNGPKTGDSNRLMIYAFAILAAGGALAVTRKKKGEAAEESSKENAQA